MPDVGLVYHPEYLKHLTGPMHPERPERLKAIMFRLEETRLTEKLVMIEPTVAPEHWITTVHTPDHLATLRKLAPKEGQELSYIDADTPMSPDSLHAAFLAVGGVLAAADAVMSRRVRSAFCAIRPPGHHAEPSRAMGFCLLNNVAIGARYLQKRHGLKKILIVDWDVHHGNGTQVVFYEDPSVLFFSTHQFPFYPGTGSEAETGHGPGLGTTVNVPMPAGSGDEEYLRMFDLKLVPAANAFRPDAILISAGFDAHRNDPLASMKLTDEGYAQLTRIVKGLADTYAGGRIVSCLEGGYHLESIAASIVRHIQVLMD